MTKLNLTQEDIKYLSTLSKEDYEVINNYINSWTEMEPAYTDQGRLEDLLYSGLKDCLSGSDHSKDFLNSMEYTIREIASENEYDYEFVLDAYHGRINVLELLYQTG